MDRHGSDALLVMLALILTAAYVGFAWAYAVKVTDARGVKLEAHAQQLAELFNMHGAISMLGGEARIPYTFGGLTPRVTLGKDEGPYVKLSLPRERGGEILGEAPISLPAEGMGMTASRAGSTFILTRTARGELTLGELGGGSCETLDKTYLNLKDFADAYAEKGIRLMITPSLREDNAWHARSVLVIPLREGSCILPLYTPPVILLPEGDAILPLVREAARTPIGGAEEGRTLRGEAYLIPLTLDKP